MRLFVEFRQALASPPLRTLRWADQQALLRGGDDSIAEDDDWPAPVNEATCGELIMRLPLDARAVAALIAAEMVFPRWASWIYGEYGDDGRRNADAVLRALQTRRRWLRGAASKSDCDSAARHADDSVMASGLQASSAPFAVYAFSYVVGAASNRTPRCADVVRGITKACTVSLMLRSAWAVEEHLERDVPPPFYRQWWTRCRAVPAINDIGTAKFAR